MFSPQDKFVIAAHIEKMLLTLHHPEMPLERPRFHLHVYGEESWSWADIDPNWAIAAEKSGEILSARVTCFGGERGVSPLTVHLGLLSQIATLKRALTDALAEIERATKSAS
jgi:hypothetical protein